MTTENKTEAKATQPETPSLWHSLLESKLNRRTLFKGAAAAAVAAATPIQLRTAEAAGLADDRVLAERTTAGQPIDPDLFFKPIAPTTEDKVIVPEGFTTQIVTAWGDDMGNGLAVGSHHDFQAFMPIDFVEKGYSLSRPHQFWQKPAMSSTDGVLVISHEYLNPMFSNPQWDLKRDFTPEEIAVQKKEVGLSLVRVQNKDGKWEMVKGDKLNRRLDATTPIILTGPAKELDGGPNAIGTLANCSGGVTPWGTVLSCEENFQDYPVPVADGGYGWEKDIYSKRHYGYVVEVDPYDPASTARKHTAMGRFRHENVAIRIADDGSVVAYMGDDRADCCVYKFVADQKLGTPSQREKNMKILESGKLYVANFGNGSWVLLDYDKNKALQEAKNKDGKPLFTSQAEVLADARAAALAAGGTPMDRPEDIEVHPKTGDVYIALTNNSSHGNFHGQIARIKEAATATKFEWDIFATGGPQSGFSSPDNLTFDGDGNLWMVTDISTSRVGTGIYKFQGNNAMFFFRTEGPFAGIAYHFASGPVQAEMTGQAWTPDGNTLFLAMQHPGEESKSLDKLTSTYGREGTKLPQSTSVAIMGKWRK
jgi:secreted PhoX family phosphatase